MCLCAHAASRRACCCALPSRREKSLHHTHMCAATAGACEQSNWYVYVKHTSSTRHTQYRRSEACGTSTQTRLLSAQLETTKQRQRDNQESSRVQSMHTNASHRYCSQAQLLHDRSKAPNRDSCAIYSACNKRDQERV